MKKKILITIGIIVMLGIAGYNTYLNLRILQLAKANNSLFSYLLIANTETKVNGFTTEFLRAVGVLNQLNNQVK